MKFKSIERWMRSATLIAAFACAAFGMIPTALAQDAQTIINDMTLGPDAAFHGVPSNYSWANGAASPQPMPVPAQNWKGEWFQAATAWGQVYIPTSGSTATNTRCQIRNVTTKFLMKSGQWITVQSSAAPEGAAFVEDFANNASTGAGGRDESANGGGSSFIVGVGPWAGYNYHFWPSGGRALVDVNNVVGVYTSCEARLILDNPSGPDDRAQCKNILQMGGDWWLNTTTGWLPDWSANSGIGAMRTKWVTPNWQTYNFCTLTPAQIQANPPVGGGGSFLVNDTDPAITYSPSVYYGSGRGVNDYQDDVHAVFNVNDTITYTFSGTGIGYITETYSDEGMVDIYIDNVFQTSVNCSTATRLTQQMVYSKIGLSSGSHTIKIVNTGGKNMLLDAFRVYTGGPSAPTAPSGLTATAASSSQINLSWTDLASTETGFKIERKTGSAGTYAQIGTVGANITTYNDTGLTASTLYYYRVRATNGTGDSAYTSEASATTSAAVVNVNLALNRPTVASSSENTGSSASNAVDGNSGTRWGSVLGVDPQWIYVDLGSTQTVRRVVLNWEAAYARAFQIQVSTNGTTWTTVWSTTSGGGGYQNITFPAASARYVRMYGTARGTSWGYSLWDFEVWAN